jgi:hypothetical protein
MRQLLNILLTLGVLFATTLPALAQEEDPWAEATLLTSSTAWVMVGLALVLMLLFLLWARRGPN